MNAAREISEKSAIQINKETANTWAARAIAYSTAAKEAEPGSGRAAELLRGYDDARHEALEHAALAEDYGKTVGRIERIIDASVKTSGHRPRIRRR